MKKTTPIRDRASGHHEQMMQLCGLLSQVQQAAAQLLESAKGCDPFVANKAKSWAEDASRLFRDCSHAAEAIKRAIDAQLKLEGM